MRILLAILAGKLSGIVSRLFGGKGSTIPGIIARKIVPKILLTLSRQIPTIILVSGTNGKTTTNNLLFEMLSKTGKRVMCNCEGANMLSGITAAFIKHATLLGTLSYDYAVLEVDEGSLPEVLDGVNPTHLIVTNFFRDQLDRFEEVNLLVKHIKTAIQTRSIQLVLNADDPFVVQLGDLGHQQPIYYGLKKDSYPFNNYVIGESKYCPHCGRKLEYSGIHYGQLGIFHCSCGFHRPTPNYLIDRITYSKGFTYYLENESYHLDLQGVYNVYNALAATVYAKEEGLTHQDIQQGLLAYKPSNGRMQRFNKRGTEWILNLVKNPAGFNLSLSETLKVVGEKQLVFLLNDLDADGNDISWIWDVDFEQVKRSDFITYICSGRRADDMALRLKYEGIDETKIIVESSVHHAIKEASKKNVITFLFPTYTNLKTTQKTLEKIL